MALAIDRLADWERESCFFLSLEVKIVQCFAVSPSFPKCSIFFFTGANPQLPVMSLISDILKPTCFGRHCLTSPSLTVVKTQVAGKVGASQPQKAKFSRQTLHCVSTRRLLTSCEVVC